MIKRLHRARHKSAAELQITAFLNLMVVLVPFLLITATFSQLAILELNLPDPSLEQSEQEPPERSLTIVVRESGLTVLDAAGPIRAFPMHNGAHDLTGLGELLVSIKRRTPGEEKVTLLLEPDIAYDTLIQLMDTVRVQPGERVDMFPLISIGDAPRESGS
jgi:biopolymer transport protein ExbD